MNPWLHVAERVTYLTRDNAKVTQTTVRYMLEHLLALCACGAPPPRIFMNFDTLGLQAEWTIGAWAIDMVVDGSSVTLDASHTDGRESSLHLVANLSDLVEWFGQFKNPT